MADSSMDKEQTMKRSFRDFLRVANHLTGIDTPVCGVSWNPPTLDVEAAERLITYLENRRALYNPYSCETSRYVIQSSLDVRR